MRGALALAILVALSPPATAAGPRAVEGAEPDGRVHTIFAPDGSVAMRFLYPEAKGPFNFVWTPKTGGWRSIDEAKAMLGGHSKFYVLTCKDDPATGKVPPKDCRGSFDLFDGGGVIGGTGFISEYQSNFVGPPQFDFIGPPVPTNNTWQGTIDGPGGPVPGGLPPASNPFADRQACINTCYSAWGVATLGCALITGTPLGAAYCMGAGGSGASSCSGNC